VHDALCSIEAGADAIGINLWSGSKRYVSEADAKKIVDAVRERALIVAVLVDPTADEVKRVRESLGIEWVQLHGQETPEFVAQFLPNAYKAVCVSANSTLGDVTRYAGEHIMLDAAAEPGNAPGGTGRTFNWDFALPVAAQRKLTLAGGLTPENVASAVAHVRPFAVDVASGVEKSPGEKDVDRVRAFVKAAKSVALQEKKQS